MTKTENRILAEKDGSFTINAEGSPPHIVDSGASVKDLTDEEITNLFRAASDHIEFARAILRKAQEQ